MPSVSMHVVIHERPLLVREPRYFACVLSMLIFRPAHWWNSFSRLMEHLTHSKSWSSRVISSANRLILISLLSIFMPLIFLSFLTLFANISNDMMKIWADNGHPCLTPCSSMKNLPVLPLFNTVIQFHYTLFLHSWWSFYQNLPFQVFCTENSNLKNQRPFQCQLIIYQASYYIL